MIENVNCSLDEPRLRDCSYSNYNGKNCGGAGVRCMIIKNINFASVNISNSVLITWEYNNSTSRQPSSFDVRCFNGHGQRQYTNIISTSNGTSRASDTVGNLLPNASYDCCVSAKNGPSTIIEIRCASIITSNDFILTATNTITIHDTCANMTATVVIVGTVLGCIIVVLLALVCGGALFHLLRSRTSDTVPKR